MRDGLCPGPHVHAYQVEEAIERHYAHIRFRPEFGADVGAHIDSVINEQEATARLLHKQISGQPRELDTTEENLIDLAADGPGRGAIAQVAAQLGIHPEALRYWNTT
jgi:hypothetical protein